MSLHIRANPSGGGGGGGGVTSVNGDVGPAVTLDTDNVTEGAANLYYTTARSQGDSLVSSVAGRTGAVTIANTDVSGLGTSSVIDVGTAANKVVQLTAAAKLPAVDGSLLTNLPSAPVTSVNTATGAVVLDTDDITEGSTNLYYTTARSQGDSLVSSVAGRTGVVTIAHTDVSGLGTSSTLDVGTAANKVVQLTAAAKLPAVDGSLLTNLPSAPVTSVNAAVGVVVLDTDDVTEGSTNLYYTTARSQGDSLVSSVAGRTGVVTIANTDVSGLGTSSVIDVGTAANKVVQLDATAKLPAVDGSQLTNLPSAPVTSVNTATGAVVLDTDDITEGSTNLYYTTARSQGDSLVSSVAGRTGVVTIANTDVSGLGTSSTLDVGTAANKVVQLTAAAKLPAVDGSLLTNLSSAPVTSVNAAVGVVVLDTDDVTEGSSNLYYTDVRADGRITNATGTTAGKLIKLDTVTAKLPAVDGSLLTGLPSAPVTSVNAAVGVVVLDTDDVTEGSTNLYYTTARSQGDSLVSSVAGRTGAVTIANTDVSGLGTSSTIDVGTTANKVVQLTAAAKLPAVDGSLLTNLPGGGGGGWTYAAITSASSPVTASTSYHYGANTSSGVIVFNLPALSGLSGGEQIRVKLNTAGSNLTLTPNGGDTVEGAATFVLSVVKSSVTVIADSGTNWEIV